MINYEKLLIRIIEDNIEYEDLAHKQNNKRDNLMNNEQYRQLDERIKNIMIAAIKNEITGEISEQTKNYTYIDMDPKDAQKILYNKNQYKEILEKYQNNARVRS